MSFPCLICSPPKRGSLHSLFHYSKEQEAPDGLRVRYLEEVPVSYVQAGFRDFQVQVFQKVEEFTSGSVLGPSV